MTSWCAREMIVRPFFVLKAAAKLGVSVPVSVAAGPKKFPKISARGNKEETQKLTVTQRGADKQN